MKVYITSGKGREEVASFAEALERPASSGSNAARSRDAVPRAGRSSP